MMQENLRNESLRNYVGGNSTVLLYFINSGVIENNDAVWEQARLLNDTVPGKLLACLLHYHEPIAVHCCKQALCLPSSTQWRVRKLGTVAAEFALKQKLGQVKKWF